MVQFAVNVPTSVGETSYTNISFIDQISWDAQREFGVAIEELGFDGLAVPDHLMTGKGATECLTTVTGLAGVTDEVYLYPKTINNPLRHGPLLAKYAATIDNISEGRLKLGMGGGWHEEEATAYGYDWPSAPDRLRAMEETIEIMTRLWTEDQVTYDGKYYTIEDCICKPQPTQDPHPPIMVGGGGEEFTLRIAAKHADTWNWRGSLPVIKQKLQILKDYCNEYNRDYDEIQKSWWARCVIGETQEDVNELLETAPQFKDENIEEEWNHLVGTPEEICEDIQRYIDLGVTEIIVEFIDFPNTDGAKVFADEVIPEFT